MTLDAGEDTLATEEVEPSIEDTLRDKLAEIEARESPQEEDTTEAVVEKAPVVVVDSGRDEKGRFKSASTEPEPEADTPVGDAGQQQVVPPELQRLGLRKEESEAFSRADKVVQDAFIRRSEEMHRGFEQLKSKAQLGDQMERALSPFMQTMQNIGVTPDVAVSKLLTADNHLRYGNPQQKIDMLLTIARDYGVDLKAAGEKHASLPPADPQVQALQTQLQQMQSWFQQQNQSREQQELSTLNSQIEQFRSDPKHAHFDSVRDEMAGLLQAGIAKGLDDAYDRAIYSNTLIRAQVLAEQQAAADATRKQDIAAKAQEAKKSAAVNMPRRGKLPAAKPTGTMEETIRAEAERLGLM